MWIQNSPDFLQSFCQLSKVGYFFYHSATLLDGHIFHNIICLHNNFLPFICSWFLDRSLVSSLGLPPQVLMQFDKMSLLELKCKCLTLDWHITEPYFYGAAILLRASTHVETLNIAMATTSVTSCNFCSFICTSIVGCFNIPPPFLHWTVFQNGCNHANISLIINERRLSLENFMLKKLLTNLRVVTLSLVYLFQDSS